MERLQLNETQQAYAEAYWQDNNVQIGDPALEGTNLVASDHVQIDNSWYAVLLGASVSSPGCVDTYIPDWGEFILPMWQIDLFVTDRAGPNGETMPIYDLQQMAARTADAAAKPEAAGAERREKRAHRRDLKELLREAIGRLPDDQERRVRQTLRAKGVLGHEDRR